MTATEEGYAVRVREYWRERGYDVDVSTRECRERPSTAPYRAVRPNLVSGLPRDFKRVSAIIVDGKLIG